MQPTVPVVVVICGAVLGGLVVPDREVARSPIPPHGVVKTGDVTLEQLEQVCESWLERPTKWRMK